VADRRDIRAANSRATRQSILPKRKILFFAEPLMDMMFSPPGSINESGRL
jgi:hypothetical protein